MMHQRLFEAITLPCDRLSLRFVDETTRVLDLRNGLLERMDTTRSEGVMVEVTLHGSTAYAATSKLTPEGVAEAARQAAAVAQAIQPHLLVHPTPPPPASGSYTTPHEKAWDALPLSDKVGLLRELHEDLSVSSVIGRTDTTLWGTTVEHHLLTSDGADLRQHFEILSLDLSATAAEGGETQTRTFGGLRGHTFQKGLELLDDYELHREARRIGKEACELLAAEQCPTGRFDLLLLPDQMMLQIHESIGHALELDRILGDERNYAGSSFVKLQDFGSLQYGNELLDVTFDPTIPQELASYRWDDDGREARKEYLIRRGTLINGLGGSTSRARSGLPGVANARASSWNRPPIDRMANLNLEPGTKSLEEMIASVEYGVLMESNRSWSIDDYREKFQFGCERGRLIERGTLTKLVKNPNYRGITVPFWHSIKAVGDVSTFRVHGTPFCGKGEPNQIIRVGHASPAVLFSSIDVFGGV